MNKFFRWFCGKRKDDRARVTIIVNDNGTFDCQSQNINASNKNQVTEATLKVVGKLLDLN